MKNGQNFQFQGVFVCLVYDLYLNFQHFLCTNIILVLIFSNYHTNRVTQLMLYTGDKLSSNTFCCLSVSVSGIGNTRSNLHFFQYIQAYKPFADHIPPNIKQYQLILTKYQPVSSYTDPVPSSTTYNSSFDESRTVYLV